MSKLIGITSYNYTTANGYETSAVDSNYIDRVIELGFVPVIIPTNSYDLKISELVSKLDGFVFTGGSDITPILYENNYFNSEIGETDYIRDIVELNLLKQVLEKNKPILGICRGFQLFCLSQNIKVEDIIPIRHNFNIKNQNNKHHNIEIKDNTLLRDLFGSSKIFINSHHHMGVRKSNVPDNYKHSLYYDGILEFLYLEQLNFIGTQWHPEFGNQDITSKAIFEQF